MLRHVLLRAHRRGRPCPAQECRMTAIDPLFLPLVLAVVVSGASAKAPPNPKSSPHASVAHGPLAHTFSIVARDSVTGELGVAVQSQYFSVGPVVACADAGVGAIATQSL